MVLLRGFCLLFFSLCITVVSISSDAQEPGAAMPDVRLEPHDGKTVFYLGEPIQLDLVFENHTGSPATLNTTIYGDLSEKVEITPATDWFQWQTHPCAPRRGLDLPRAGPLSHSHQHFASPTWQWPWRPLFPGNHHK